MAVYSSATANQALTATLLKYLQNPAGYIGSILAPFFLTSQQSAKYYVFDKENALNIPDDISRAPGAPYKRTRLKLSDDSYSTSNKGIEIPVDDEERKKYATAFSADEAAMTRVRNIIVANYEKRVKALAVTATATAAPSVKWDAYTNDASNPVKDVDVVKAAIVANSGMEPNTMVISKSVFNALKEHPVILDKIKYSQRGTVTVDILSEVFGLPRILVPGLVTNTAADGQTVSPDYIWNDSVIICHTQTSPDLQAPNFLRTFVWTEMTGADGVLVETYRDDSVQSDIHRAKQYTDEKITGNELGYHLSDVLT